jgi:hypothetical protein
LGNVGAVSLNFLRSRSKFDAKFCCFVVIVICAFVGSVLNSVYRLIMILVLHFLCTEEAREEKILRLN